MPQTWPVTLLLPVVAHAGAVDVVSVDGFENGCGNLIYAEPFALPDGSAWPAPWSVLGNVALADVQQEMARLQPHPTGYSLARMGAQIANSNVEVRFMLRLEDLATQGVGFYVRQNGGYLQQTTTHGQGYAAFIESFRNPPGIGLWREVDGTEMQMLPTTAMTLTASIDYRVRLQVLQSTPAQTLLRAKLWRAGDAEPGAWDISFTDGTGALQNASGGIAVDSWSSRTSAPISAYTFVDNIELVSLCAP